MNITSCLVCNESKALNQIPNTPYFRCIICGHSSRKSVPAHTTMINETLSAESVRKPTYLTKFWVSIVKQYCTTFLTIIDIGSASGRFLFHIKNHFQNILGIEISESSLKFSTEELGLPVFNKIPDNIEALSCVTFWHTLEHIPIDQINNIFSTLKKSSTNDCKLIISVPNGDSIWGKYFLKYFSFLDKREHIHQYSYESLERVLDNNNVNIIKVIPSALYSSFNAVQSLINFIFSPHNYLYYKLKRNIDLSPENSTFKLLINLILSIILLPLAVIAVLYEQLYPKKAAALTVIAEWKKQNEKL